MLLYSYIAVALMASFFNSGDAIAPTFSLPAGGDGSVDMDENKVNGTTVATIAADGNGTVTFALETTDVPFEIDGASGVLTNNALIDFEGDTQNYVLIIVATDDNDNATASATLTVAIQDVNDNDPTFSAASFSACAVDGSVVGTTVYTLTSTDLDSTATAIYNITDGNTDTDFEIATTYIKNLNVLDMGTTKNYTLTVQVSDGSNTDTANVVVTVESTCSGASALAVSLITLLMGLVYALN